MTGILIFLGVLIVGGGAVWIAAYRFGKLSVEHAADKATIDAGERIADAVAKVPTNSDDLLDELSDGKRKL